MKLLKILAPTILVSIAAVACQQQAAEDNIAAGEVNDLAESDMVAPGPSTPGTAPDNKASEGNAQVPGNDTGDEGSAPETPAAAVIPAQYHGRWGMVPNDCDRSRSDAKGLITIADRTLTFYESRATLKEQRPAIATSFSGLFAFTGEGQNWEKVVTFTREGDRLTRADSDGRYTYTRCR